MADDHENDNVVEFPCDVEPPCEEVPGAKAPTVIDDVNHPQHYNQGGVEAIEIIEHIVFGYQKYPIVLGLVWQVLKYIIRAPYKGNLKQDLKKANWYLNRAIHKL